MVSVAMRYCPVLKNRAKWNTQSDVVLKSGYLVWVTDPTAREDITLSLVSLNLTTENTDAHVPPSLMSDITRPTAKLAPVLPSLGAEVVHAQA